MNDNQMIWEAYQNSLEEGWGKNLAMMGMGALLAHGAMKHNPAKPEKHSKPEHTQVQSKQKRSPSLEHEMNKLEYHKEMSRVLKKTKWVEKYYVPIDNNGEPLLDFKTLNRIRKKHNLSTVEEKDFRAAQKTFGR
jgi:hypothetical protein